jgi:VWFA-related protein
MKKIVSVAALVILSSTLTGCPQQIESMVEKMRPPKDHKPNYMTSSVSLSRYAAAFSTMATTQAISQEVLEEMLQKTGKESLNKESRDTFQMSLQKAIRQRIEQSSPPAHADDFADMDTDSILQSKTTSPQSINVPQSARDSLLTTQPPIQRQKLQQLRQSQQLTGKAPSSATAKATQNRASARQHLPKTETPASSILDTNRITRTSAGKQETTQQERQKAPQLATSAPRAAAGMPQAEPAQSNALLSDASASLPAPEDNDPAPLPFVPQLFSLDIRSVDDHQYPEQIELQAVIVDTAGRFVTGLAPKDGSFRRYWRAVTDSALGTAYKIRDFTVQEIRETLREPNAIAFVLDHSPSMGEGRARKLQEAIRRVLGLLKSEDAVSVVKFTSAIKVEVPLTNDSARYKAMFQVDGLQGYSGGTALYDGALAGVEEVSKAPAHFKKTVIVFSDGGDNSSKKRLRDVIRAAYSKNVKVHTIGYGLTEEGPMIRMAENSGGKYYRIYSTREFPFVFADIYRSLKNYYRISYKPPQAAALHTASVRVMIPEIGNMRLAGRGMYDRSIVTAVDTVGSIKLINIEFETGKSAVRAESLPQLRELARSLQANTTITIEVRGHTDDRGSDELNQKLSEERAASVAQELVRMGVERNRITTKGFGKSQPIAPNDSEDNRRRNRRTEFVITGGVQ